MAWTGRVAPVGCFFSPGEEGGVGRECHPLLGDTSGGGHGGAHGVGG